MMNATLKSFFHNGIFPFEEISPQDPEYRNINRKISGELSYFTGKMSPEDAKRLEEMEALFSSASTFFACESFTYGFRLGVSLMADALAHEA